MRKLVSDFLTRQDYEVLEAEDGEEAVDLFFRVKNIALIDFGCEDRPPRWTDGRYAGRSADILRFRSLC